MRLCSKAVLHSFHTGAITGSNPVGAISLGSVAQSAERLAHNQLVTGSCPVGPTIFNRRLAQSGERFPYKEEVVRSIRTSPIRFLRV